MECAGQIAKGASVMTQRTTGPLSTALLSVMAQKYRMDITALRTSAISTAAGWETAQRMASLAFVMTPTTARPLTAARLGLRRRPPAVVSVLPVTVPLVTIKELASRLQVAMRAPAMIQTTIGPQKCANLNTSAGSWHLVTAAFQARVTITAPGWANVTPAEIFVSVLIQTTAGPQSAVRYGMRRLILSQLAWTVNVLC